MTDIAIARTVIQDAMINAERFDTPITCWDFTRFIQKEVYGRELPSYTSGTSIQQHVKAIRDAIIPEGWALSDTPQDGCIVEMAHNIYPHHVGTFMDIDGGVIVHAYKTRAVMITVDSMLSAKLAGWRRFIYYARAH